MPPTLTTARLILRPHRVEDFDAYAAMWAEPAVVRLIGGAPIPREATWTRLLRQIGMWPALGFGFFALEDRETGAFVGEAGFHDLKRDLVPSIEGTMEAGWALREAAQGKGLAEEAMRAALAWAEAQDQGLRFTCIVDPANAPSLRIAAKLGFHAFAQSRYGGKEVVLLERPLRSLAVES